MTLNESSSRSSEPDGVPEGFLAACAAAAERLRAEEKILVVSHFDADGLAAAALLARALERRGTRVEAEAVSHFDPAMVEACEEFLVLIDMGATHAVRLTPHAERLLVIDHHKTEGEPEDERAFFVLNPWSHGLDGGTEACSATVAFWVALALGRNEDLAGLGVVGLLADAQEKQGLHGLNRATVERGIAAGVVAVEERLRLFGYERKSLVGMLAGSYDLAIPEVTGDIGGARRFLARLGIPSRNRRGQETRYRDLTEEQRRRLIVEASTLATKRPAIAPYYLLPRERGFFRDARQFATILNSCGRLKEPALGFAIAKGDEEARNHAGDVLRDYRVALNDAYAWQTSVAERTKRYALIDAGNRIPPNLIGTVCSMVARSGDVPEGVIVIGVAVDGEQAKASLRCAGNGCDVHALLKEMMTGIPGTHGGHAQAAGAVFPTGEKELFLERARSILRNL